MSDENSRSIAAGQDPDRTRLRKHGRRRLDLRCGLMAVLAVVLGLVSWHAQSWLAGTPLYQPSQAALLAWFVLSAFVTACIDPRSPWINWIMIFLGAYVLSLPMLPKDPLLGLGVIAGFFNSAIGVAVGALVPVVASYWPPITTPRFLAWAGLEPAADAGKE